MRILAFALISTIIGHATLASAKQPCVTSFWVTMGQERVRVCCDQTNFCYTKYGVYSQ